MDGIQKTSSEDGLLKLDNQLCFALYVCSKEIIRRYKPLLDPLGLTYTSYIAMMALWEKDMVPVKDLGARLFLDSGTLTPLLKKMEGEGLIQRTRSEKDERTVYIALTEKGHALKAKCASIPPQMFCTTKLDKDSAACMLNGLHGLIAKLCAEEPQAAVKTASETEPADGYTEETIKYTQIDDMR